MGSASALAQSAVVSLCLLLGGCVPYADFTLPRLSPSDSPTHFSFEAQPVPVIARGAVGEWDSHDALNPSVVIRRGVYYNFYSGFDGKTWHTGVATSVDGIHWQKRGSVLSPDPKSWEGSYIAANGSALLRGRQFFYWYQAGPKSHPQIGLARSYDGHVWTKSAKPVLGTGPRGSWDELGVGDPFVFRLRGYYYMYYLGQDRARRQRLGLARSSDGVQWRKLRTNPVLGLGEPGSFDENGLGEPALWTTDGYYWMLYTGRDRTENRRLGLARSTDGVRWQKLASAFAGSAAWDSKVICDPSVEVRGDAVRVWFGGGNVASPDENLNGQIGVATLTAVSANLHK